MVIVGGSFGGLTVAKMLAHEDGLDVVVIEKKVGVCVLWVLVFSVITRFKKNHLVFLKVTNMQSNEMNARSCARSLASLVTNTHTQDYMEYVPGTLRALVEPAHLDRICTPMRATLPAAGNARVVQVGPGGSDREMRPHLYVCLGVLCVLCLCRFPSESNGSRL